MSFYGNFNGNFAGAWYGRVAAAPTARPGGASTSTWGKGAHSYSVLTTKGANSRPIGSGGGPIRLPWGPLSPAVEDDDEEELLMLLMGLLD